MRREQRAWGEAGECLDGRCPKLGCCGAGSVTTLGCCWLFSPLSQPVPTWVSDRECPKGCINTKTRSGKLLTGLPPLGSHHDEAPPSDLSPNLSLGLPKRCGTDSGMIISLMSLQWGQASLSQLGRSCCAEQPWDPSRSHSCQPNSLIQPLQRLQVYLGANSLSCQRDGIGNQCLCWDSAGVSWPVLPALLCVPSLGCTCPHSQATDWHLTSHFLPFLLRSVPSCQC